jgi:hypothetical protein
VTATVSAVSGTDPAACRASSSRILTPRSS